MIKKYTCEHCGQEFSSEKQCGKHELRCAENHVTYEGILHSKHESGWREDYLGEKEISDIVDFLEGKMVRLEVIE